MVSHKRKSRNCYIKALPASVLEHMQTKTTSMFFILQRWSLLDASKRRSWNHLRCLKLSARSLLQWLQIPGGRIASNDYRTPHWPNPRNTMLSDQWLSRPTVPPVNGALLVHRDAHLSDWSTVRIASFLLNNWKSIVVSRFIAFSRKCNFIATADLISVVFCPRIENPVGL